MSVRSRPLALGAVLLCALTGSLHAQTEHSGFTAPERQALMSHRLTMDNIRKTADASAKLAELAKKDPKLGDVREGEEAKTLTELVAKMDALPPAKAAIASSGLSTRDFLYTMFELQMTSSAVMMKQMGGAAAEGAEKLPVSAENAQFYVSHRSEIEPLVKHMGNDDDKEDE